MEVLPADNQQTTWADCFRNALAGQHPRLYVLDENPGNGSANLNSWRLSVLEMLQPEDELEELLASGDFGAASALAAKHKLPEDPIYKYAADHVLCMTNQGSEGHQRPSEQSFQ